MRAGSTGTSIPIPVATVLRTNDDGVTDAGPGVEQLLPIVAAIDAEAPAEQHAEAVGLRYVHAEELEIRRVRRGRGFSYVRSDGSTLDAGGRARLEALAIPPAWVDVQICEDPHGHIQATGVDAAGRKQYRYHPRWRSVRDATKFHRMGNFAQALPRIRDEVDADLRRRHLDRRKVLALVVALLDETLIRIGTERYTHSNGSRGLTTLLDDHVDVVGARIHFSFPGKSGRTRDVEVSHRRLARQVLRCEEIPGQRLFAYREGGGWHEIDSGAVNAYLQEIAGAAETAKDFRTWGATVTVAETLHELGPTTPGDVDTAVLEAIDMAAERLGNTRAVARASYVDPRIVDAYRLGRLDDEWDANAGDVARMSPAERAVRRVVER